MEASAKLRYARLSPQKTRLVVDMVRGKDVQEATEVLVLSDKKASNIVKKLLDSAVANANRMIEDNKIDVDLDNLYIRRIFVDEGPTWKRYRPRAMGRYTRIFKRTSHITVVLDER